MKDTGIFWNDAKTVGLRIPVLTVSEANTREHWTRRSKRKKLQQLATTCHFNVSSAALRGYGQPANIHLVRLGTRKLDSDNLAGSFKHVRDAIAAWFGFDDGDERTSWTYDQRIVHREDVGSKVYITWQWHQ